MRTEQEIKDKIELHKKLLSETKGKGSGNKKLEQLRAIELLTWVLT